MTARTCKVWVAVVGLLVSGAYAAIAQTAMRRQAVTGPHRLAAGWPGVDALLRRAVSEPPVDALYTLDEAVRAARDDRGALLRISAAAYDRGTVLKYPEQTDHVDRQFFNRARAIQERLVPGTEALAATLYQLALSWAWPHDPRGGIEPASKAVEVYQRLKPGSRELADACAVLGGLLADAKMSSEARAYLHAARAIRARGSHSRRDRLPPLELILPEVRTPSEEQLKDPDGWLELGRPPTVEPVWVSLALLRLAEARGDQAARKQFAGECLRAIAERVEQTTHEARRGGAGLTRPIDAPPLCTWGRPSGSLVWWIGAPAIRRLHESAYYVAHFSYRDATPALRERIGGGVDRLLAAAARLPAPTRDDVVDAGLQLLRSLRDERGLTAALKRYVRDADSVAVWQARLCYDRGDRKRGDALLQQRLAAPGNHLQVVVWWGELMGTSGRWVDARAFLAHTLPPQVSSAPLTRASMWALWQVVWEFGEANQFHHPDAKTIQDQIEPLAERLSPIIPSGSGWGGVAMAVAEALRGGSGAEKWYRRAGALGRLAAIARGRGDLREAERLATLGRDYFWMGLLAAARHENQKAKALLRRAAFEREMDPRSFWVANVLLALGSVELELGERTAAEATFRRALSVADLHEDNFRLPVSDVRVSALEGLARVQMGRGNLDAARELVTRALGTQRRTSLLVRLAEIEDERGDVARAAGLATEALRHLLEADGDPVSKRPLLRRLSPLLVDREAEVSRLLRGADAISGQIDRLPADSVPAGEVTLPIVRFAAAPELRPESVGIRLCFVSPLPVCRYRLWLNGRPIGPASGFDLPGPDEKGRLLDKGRLLEKGESLDESRVFEKGRLLEKGEDRVALAAELPAEVAALVRLPQYSQLVQIRHSVPVEDSDGEFIRIAIQAETTGGSVSDREIQRLRRPQVEQARGSLRVLAVGIGDYPLLPKLKYAAADAISLADAFRSQAEPESSASLYRGADIRLLVNADATLARIREALDQLATDTRPGDTVVLALSGHGIAVRPPAVDLSNLPAEAMMAAKPAPTQTYFAPARFDPENPAGTGLPWSEVVARLEPLRKVAKTVWLLADCCRSAPGLRRTPAPDMPLRKGEVLAADTRDLKRGLDEGGNLILCAASDADTPSYESDDLKHGLFTQAWLEALRGEAPDGVYRDVPRGRVLTLSGLQFWLDASVTKHARSVGVRQRVEFPRLEGSFSPSMPVFVPVTR